MVGLVGLAAEGLGLAAAVFFATGFFAAVLAAVVPVAAFMFMLVEMSSETPKQLHTFLAVARREVAVVFFVVEGLTALALTAFFGASLDLLVVLTAAFVVGLALRAAAAVRAVPVDLEAAALEVEVVRGLGTAFLIVVAFAVVLVVGFFFTTALAFAVFTAVLGFAAGLFYGTHVRRVV